MGQVRAICGDGPKSGMSLTRRFDLGESPMLPFATPLYERSGRVRGVLLDWSGLLASFQGRTSSGSARSEYASRVAKRSIADAVHFLTTPFFGDLPKGTLSIFVVANVELMEQPFFSKLLCTTSNSLRKSGIMVGLILADSVSFMNSNLRFIRSLLFRFEDDGIEVLTDLRRFQVEPYPTPLIRASSYVCISPSWLGISKHGGVADFSLFRKRADELGWLIHDLGLSVLVLDVTSIEQLQRIYSTPFLIYGWRNRSVYVDHTEPR